VLRFDYLRRSGSVSVDESRPVAALRGLVIDRHSPRVDRGFPGVDRHRTPSAVDDGESPTIDGGAARVLQVRVAAKLARTHREGASAVQRGRSKTCRKALFTHGGGYRRSKREGACGDEDDGL
jgi:hypothetical protein